MIVYLFFSVVIQLFRVAEALDLNDCNGFLTPLKTLPAKYPAVPLNDTIEALLHSITRNKAKKDVTLCAAGNTFAANKGSEWVYLDSYNVSSLTVIGVVEQGVKPHIVNVDFNAIDPVSVVVQHVEATTLTFDGVTHVTVANITLNEALLRDNSLPVAEDVVSIGDVVAAAHANITLTSSFYIYRVDERALVQWTVSNVDMTAGNGVLSLALPRSLGAEPFGKDVLEGSLSNIAAGENATFVFKMRHLTLANVTGRFRHIELSSINATAKNSNLRRTGDFVVPLLTASLVALQNSNLTTRQAASGAAAAPLIGPLHSTVALDIIDSHVDAIDGKVACKKYFALQGGSVCKLCPDFAISSDGRTCDAVTTLETTTRVTKPYVPPPRCSESYTPIPFTDRCFQTWFVVLCVTTALLCVCCCLCGTVAAILKRKRLKQGERSPLLPDARNA